ncbi:MAG: hypothetical protein WDO56_14150 [Gammaproteobacteria bacterium]
MKDADDPDRYGLALSARRNSWGPNYVRFGLNLQDDFEGNSTYNAAARFVLSEITQPGGEWVWDLQVGERSLFATEVYLPFSQSGPYFMAPHAQIEARNVTKLDDKLQNIIAEYRVRSFSYGLDFGREFGNWGEIRTGYAIDRGNSHVRVGDPSLPTGDFDSRGYFVRMSYDRLDDINFPRHGQSRDTRVDRPARRPWRGSDGGSRGFQLDRGSHVRPADGGVVDHARHRVEPAHGRSAQPVSARRVSESLGHQGGFAHRPALRHHAPAALSTGGPRRPGFSRCARIHRCVTRGWQRLAENAAMRASVVHARTPACSSASTRR